MSRPQVSSRSELDDNIRLRLYHAAIARNKIKNLATARGGNILEIMEFLILKEDLESVKYLYNSFCKNSPEIFDEDVYELCDHLIDKGNLSALKYLFNNFPSIVSDLGGYDEQASLFFQCCGQGRTEIADFFISERGINVNRIYEGGYSALYNAAGLGRLDIVNLLIEKGADPNLSNVEFPIQVASQNGHLGVVRSLIAAGADVDKRYSESTAPPALLFALRQENYEILIELIRANASVDISRDLNVGMAAMDLFLKSDIPQAQGYAREVWEKYPQHRDLMTVHACTTDRGSTVLSFLIENGLFDVNTIWDDGFTPLYCSAQMGKLDAVNLLLQNGANPNISGTNFPIQAAAQEGEIDVVKALIRGGAEVDKRPHLISGEGENAFDMAAPRAFTIAWLGDHDEVAVELLKGGADYSNHRRVYCAALPEEILLEKVANYLYLAVEKNDPDGVIAVLRTGDANVDLVIREGDARVSILEKAFRNGYYDIAKELLKAGADITSVTVDDSFQEFLRQNHNIADNDGNTLLHHAAKANNHDAVNMLIRAGADPYARNSNGQAASDFMSEDGMKTLLDGLSSVDISNSSRGAASRPGTDPGLREFDLRQQEGINRRS